MWPVVFTSFNPDIAKINLLTNVALDSSQSIMYKKIILKIQLAKYENEKKFKYTFLWLVTDD